MPEALGSILGITKKPKNKKKKKKVKAPWEDYLNC
jgi:hypothetical protein